MAAISSVGTGVVKNWSDTAAWSGGVVPGDGMMPMIIVTGLPGSGTTLLMRILEAGGVPVMHDPAHHPADARHPHGHYEVDLANVDWSGGQAVKVVDVDLDAIGPGEHRYVLAWRDPREITMAAGVTQDEAARRQLACRDRCRRCLVMHYACVMRHTRAECVRLADHLGRSLDITAMCGVVDHSLWHHRAR